MSAGILIQVKGRFSVLLYIICLMSLVCMSCISFREVICLFNMKPISKEKMVRLQDV